MKSRTKARSIALQVLYEVDISSHAAGEILARRFDWLKIEDSLRTFISQIVNGVVEYRSILDEFISNYAPEWPLDQVAYIDRNLLRIALWEIAVYRKTPIKVVVNEAVELAKFYGAEGSARFVNGVLGECINNLKEIKVSMEIIHNESPEE